jgi:hypothetical protein
MTNWWNIAKGLFALGWIGQFLVWTLSITALQVLIFVPVIGPAILGAIDSVWIALSIIALPVFLFVSLKLLAWIDGLMLELGIKLNARTQFVKARNKLTRNLPKWSAELVNFAT